MSALLRCSCRPAGCTSVASVCLHVLAPLITMMRGPLFLYTHSCRLVTTAGAVNPQGCSWLVETARVCTVCAHNLKLGCGLFGSCCAGGRGCAFSTRQQPAQGCGHPACRRHLWGELPAGGWDWLAERNSTAGCLLPLLHIAAVMPHLAMLCQARPCAPDCASGMQSLRVG